MVLTGETEVQEENLSQCHFVGHRCQHGLALDRTWVSAVRSRRLTCRGLMETKINLSKVKD